MSTPLLCDRCGRGIAHGMRRYAAVGSEFGIWLCDGDYWQDVEDGSAVYCEPCYCGCDDGTTAVERRTCATAL